MPNRIGHRLVTRNGPLWRFPLFGAKKNWSQISHRLVTRIGALWRFPLFGAKKNWSQIGHRLVTRIGALCFPLFGAKKNLAVLEGNGEEDRGCALEKPCSQHQTDGFTITMHDLSSQ